MSPAAISHFSGEAVYGRVYCVLLMSESVTGLAPAGLENAILNLRGQRVILDSDLAAVYGVTTSRFNEAIKRNRNRFPPDFAFQLTREELTHLISQSATSSARHGGVRKLPWAFTEHGAVMASNAGCTPRLGRVESVTWAGTAPWANPDPARPPREASSSAGQVRRLRPSRESPWPGRASRLAPGIPPGNANWAG